MHASRHLDESIFSTAACRAYATQQNIALRDNNDLSGASATNLADSLGGEGWRSAFSFLSFSSCCNPIFEASSEAQSLITYM